jgi:dihydroneopterin aldolase
MHSTDIIRIHNASFYAYHGVASDEQQLGGKFEVDVELHADLSEAIAHDSLKRTINYESVYALVRELVTSRNYFLIEALANTIAKGILSAYAGVSKVVVRVRKPHPPVKGVIDYVEVEVTGGR